MLVDSLNYWCHLLIQVGKLRPIAEKGLVQITWPTEVKFGPNSPSYALSNPKVVRSPLLLEKGRKWLWPWFYTTNPRKLDSFSIVFVLDPERSETMRNGWMNSPYLLVLSPLKLFCNLWGGQTYTFDALLQCGFHRNMGQEEVHLGDLATTTKNDNHVIVHASYSLRKMLF